MFDLKSALPCPCGTCILVGQIDNIYRNYLKYSFLHFRSVTWGISIEWSVKTLGVQVAEDEWGGPGENGDQGKSFVIKGHL